MRKRLAAALLAALALAGGAALAGTGAQHAAASAGPGTHLHA